MGFSLSSISKDVVVASTYPVSRKILLVMSGIIALFFITDIVTLLGAQDPEFARRSAIATAVSGSFVLTLGLLWHKTTYSVVGVVFAMFISLWSGEYLVSLLVVPFLGAMIVLSETRRYANLYFIGALIWAGLIVVKRPLDVGFLGLLVPLLGLAYFAATFARRLGAQREADRIRIAELKRKQREAVEAERKAIARDLHDIVAHDITVISMQAKAAEFSGDPAVAQAALKVIGATSKEALQDLRVMLNVLRSDGPATRVEGSLVDSAGNAASSLEILIGVEVFADRLIDLGHPTKTVADARLVALPQSAQAALYRVLQESTTNIVKHAEPGATCRIEAKMSGESVWLEVANELPSPTMNFKAGRDEHSSGITGMTDRMATFGGTLSARRQGGDWVVRAELPATILNLSHPELREENSDANNT